MSIAIGLRRVRSWKRARGLVCGIALIAGWSLAGCSSSDSGGSSATDGARSGGAAGSVSRAGNGGSGGALNARAGGGGVSGNGGASGSSGGTAGNGGANSAGAAGSSGGVGGSSGAAGSAGVASGGASGAAAYNPCPTNGSACRIMPLGDSITDGCCGQNTITMGASYRYELFHLSLQNGKKLTFVGSQQSGPNTVDNDPFPKHHEGHPGWTIADGGGRSGLQTPISGWLQATPPDIITLMIGTNDVDIQLDLTNAPKRLGTLLDTIIETSPKALIVLAQIVPTGNDDENMRVRAYNEAMPALVKARADAGKHVILVDMYDAFTQNANFKTALLANSLHPTDAGYAVMANTWWDAIGKLLPGK